MLPNGPVVHQQLMHSYQAVQADLEAVRGQIASKGAETEELGSDRQDTLLSLAQYYLPELTEQAIEQTWSEIRGDIRRVLLRKQEHQSRVELQFGDASQRQLELETSLEAVDKRLDEAQQRMQELSQQLTAQLAADESFSQLAEKAGAAEAALERAEGRLAEVKQDAEQKLPAYEQSSLFQYLYERGLGTEAYRSRGFTRRMDRWVGKLIGYHQARKSYEFLRDTPRHMERIVVEDREDLETVLKELERQRDRAAESIGLTVANNEIEAARKEREQVLEKLDKTRLQADQLRTELLELEDSRGPYYRDAVELFRGMLEQMDDGSLADRAKQTPEIRDDQIIARLQGLESEIGKIGTEVEQRQQQIRDFDRQLQEIGRLIQKFRAAGYESTRSQFQASLDIVGALDRYRKGHSTIESVWVQIRRSQQFGPTPMEQVSNVAAHPLTQVLVHAMATAASSAMSDHARRAGNRRAHRNRRR
ncbi:coiled-coil domain-containing protein [Roseimaritima ulvae]|uniref:Chromosome partition protein Smc n=1 Tax=Roseimaritima ulvae TaxID=980254 RepID=A0A5B9QPH6_9BACT|nr:hypothetical protein [Roseimaritima ulvae]QEG39802.1 hypothetical protein UC8_18010 [Roseimaritima ulvae]